MGYPRVLEHADEWTLRDDLYPRGGPGHGRDDDREGQHVEEKEPEHHGAQRRRDGDLWIRRLAGSDRNDFDAVEGEEADDYRHPHAAHAVGHESAGKAAQVVEPNRW